MSQPAPRSEIPAGPPARAIPAFVGLAAFVLLAGPTSLLAQEPAVAAEDAALQGIVADGATGEPIGAATLSLVGLDVESRTDRTGRFSFSNPPMGPVTIRVQAPGYVTMVEEVDVTPDAISFVQFFLPELSAALGELFIEADAAEGQRAIEAGTGADLLARRVLGARQRTGMVGETDFQILLRGVSSLTQIDGPAVFIDGVRVRGGLGTAFDVLSQVPASDIEDIRVLRGPASTNHVFGADGAIYVETRSGPEG